MNEKIAVIDLDSCIYTIFHPNKVLDNKGNPLRTEDGKRFIYQDKTELEIIQATDDLMNLILTSSEATHFVAFVKGHNTLKNKLLINSEYKQDRKEEQPKFWNFTKEYLKLKWKAIEVNNIETDDAVRITNLKTPNSFIAAIDSDLLGLSGKHYNWRKNEWIINTTEQENYNFWFQMITGNHNNIKGIPGKGEKFAEKLLANTNFTNVDKVFSCYIDYFGESVGIYEFYKNYTCIKTLTDHPDFIIPEIQEYKRVLNDSPTIEI